MNIQDIIPEQLTATKRPLDPVADRKVRTVLAGRIKRLRDLLEADAPETVTVRRRGELHAYREITRWLDGDTES